jgi:Domain of unknown function (DUF4153)
MATTAAGALSAQNSLENGPEDNLANKNRHNAENDAWPIRPWLYAIIGALGLLLVDRLLDWDYEGNSTGPSLWQEVLSAGIIVAGLAFIVTAERKRLNWAIIFAIAAGLVMMFVGWFTGSYNKGRELAEFPFLAGLFGCLVAAPLFQVVRDEGGWRFPYTRLHTHVWTDAVIGAAALAFTGISFALAFLIARLFEAIGITLIKDLLDEGWFAAPLAGFAFGAALGMLRERDRLVATLQKLVLTILSVLAPILALALGAFLLSLPFTGLAKLWEANFPTTPVLLLSSAGAVGLINAVIGDGKADGSQNRILRISALILSITVLPLAVVAAISMGVRINQYGWTPDRIWGLIAIIVACVYGVAYLISALKGWRAKAILDWDDHIRPANIKIAIGVCVLAIALALPILDFGRISATDQLMRLRNGLVSVKQFDWRAMAFDFGPAGRRTLKFLSENGYSEDERKLAKVALGAENRYDLADTVQAESVDNRPNFIVDGTGPAPDEELRSFLVRDGKCRKPCRLRWLSPQRVMVISPQYDSGPLGTDVYSYVSQAEVDEAKSKQAEAVKRSQEREKRGEELVASAPYDIPTKGWSRDYMGEGYEGRGKDLTANSKIEIRTVTRQQVFVDGKPASDLMTEEAFNNK